MGSTSAEHLESRRTFLKSAGALCAALPLAALAGCASGESTAGEGAAGASSAGSAGSAGAASQEGSGSSGDIQSVDLFLFDTIVSIQARCSAELMESIAERCEFFEQHFSRTIQGSDIWNINHAAGAAVEVAQETADCIALGVRYGKETNGLFDISIGAVSTLWDFNEEVKPSDASLEEAVAHVDYRGITVDATTVTLADPKAMLDLGGIAKGFIADDLTEMFRAGGCESACISLGGNVYVLGESFDGDDWNVGVRNPNERATSVVAQASAANKSFVTSGLYERSFVQDGVRYYHILDPKTGYPVTTDLESVSIESDLSVEGDVYSTTLFLLGKEAGLSLLNSDARFEGLVIDSDGLVSQSDGCVFWIEDNSQEAAE